MARIELLRTVKSGGKWYEPGTIMEHSAPEYLLETGAARLAPDKEASQPRKGKGRKKAQAEPPSE